MNFDVLTALPAMSVRPPVGVYSTLCTPAPDSSVPDEYVPTVRVSVNVAGSHVIVELR